MSTLFVKKSTKFLPVWAAEEKTETPACRIFSFFLYKRGAGSEDPAPEHRFPSGNLFFL